MRLARTLDDRWGLVGGETFVDVTASMQQMGVDASAPTGDLYRRLAEISPQLQKAAASGGPLPLKEMALRSPVERPGKIVAAPVNYRKHLDEARADEAISFGNPVAEIKEVGLFLKASSSLIGPGESIRLRHLDRRNDHEIELAVVIGKTADRVSREQALEYVAGYCIGLDITLRGKEDRSFRKSIDTYSVLGPWLVTPDEIGDPAELAISLSVNGNQRQRADVADLVLSVPDLIEFASSFYTLYPGDVIMTGTPEGVGPIVPGDLIEAGITRIGTMRVAVAAA